MQPLFSLVILLAEFCKSSLVQEWLKFTLKSNISNVKVDLSAVFYSIWRLLQYLTSNWRQLGENTANQSTLTFNSSRTVKNQTMVLFWLLIGLKFREFWYINLYVLKKKVFYLYRVWACDVMKSLQWNEAYTKKVYDGFWNFRTQANIFQWIIFSYNFLLIVMNCDKRNPLKFLENHTKTFYSYKNNEKSQKITYGYYFI